MDLIDNLPKSVPKKYRGRIEHWDDERGIGNSLLVSLKDGWHWAGIDRFAGMHVAGFDTVSEVVVQLRYTEECKCEVCLDAIAVAKQEGLA